MDDHIFGSFSDMAYSTAVDHKIHYISEYNLNVDTGIYTAICIVRICPSIFSDISSEHIRSRMIAYMVYIRLDTSSIWEK